MCVAGSACAPAVPATPPEVAGFAALEAVPDKGVDGVKTGVANPAAEMAPPEETKEGAETYPAPPSADVPAPPEPETPLPDTDAEGLLPAEPAPPTAPGADAAPAAEAYSCALFVRCEVLAADPSRLAEEKRRLVPEDGILLAVTDAVFYAGESVFELLKRETRQAEIPMEFTLNPGFGSAYVEGIGNLYEKDAGPLSGWTYRVNGETPGVGCSQYPLQAGDRVEWLYTCELGRDLETAKGTDDAG
jgi:hypothetical protein